MAASPTCSGLSDDADFTSVSRHSYGAEAGLEDGGGAAVDGDLGGGDALELRLVVQVYEHAVGGGARRSH